MFIGKSLSNDSGITPTRYNSTSLKNIGLKVSAYIVPLLALIILTSIPRASAWFATYAECVAKCATVMSPPACTVLCGPFLLPYFP